MDFGSLGSDLAEAYKGCVWIVVILLVVSFSVGFVAGSSCAHSPYQIKIVKEPK